MVDTINIQKNDYKNKSFDYIVNDLIKKYVNNIFILKLDHIEVKCKIFISEEKIDGKNMYLIIHFLEKDTNLRIFYITLVLNGKFKRQIYLDFFGKSDQYSGTLLMNFLIKFSKMLKATYISLYDASSINYNKKDELKNNIKFKSDIDSRFSLQMFKILTNKETFYEKFNFKRVILYNESKLVSYHLLFDQNTINRKIKYIQNVKILTFLKKLKKYLQIRVRRKIDYYALNDLLPFPNYISRNLSRIIFDIFKYNKILKNLIKDNDTLLVALNKCSKEGKNIMIELFLNVIDALIHSNIENINKKSEKNKIPDYKFIYNVYIFNKFIGNNDMYYKI